MPKKKVTLIILALLITVGTIFGYKAVKAKKIAEIKEKVESYLEENNLKDLVDIGEYDVSLLKREAYLRNIKIKGLRQEDKSTLVEVPAIKEVVIKRFEEDKDVGPLKLSLEMKGIDLRIYIKNLNEWKSFSLDTALDSSYDKEKKELTEDFFLSGKGLFKISWKWKAKNVDGELIHLAREINANKLPFSSPEVNLFISKLLQIKPSFLELSFYDRGFHDLLVEIVSKETGASTREIRKKVINELKKTSSEFTDERLKTLIEALIDTFSKGKGGVEVVITNTKDYSLQDMVSLLIGVAVKGASPEKVLKEAEKFLEVEVKKI